MIRKRGKYLEFEFMERGERIFGTFNGKKDAPFVTTKREAIDYESAVRTQVRAGTYRRDDLVEDRLEEFAKFFDDVYMVYAKENTTDWKHPKFRGEVLKHFFGNKKFSEITPLIVVQYINQRLRSVTNRNHKRSPVTIYKELRLASAVFNMAIGEGLAKVNPCLSIPKSVKKKLPARNKRERVLTRSEEAKLFDQLTGRRAHLWTVARFALETGLRKSELCRLETEHVNLGEVSLFFRINGKRIEVLPNELLVAQSKSGKPRTIPMSAAARRIAEMHVAEVITEKYLFTSNKTGGMIAEIKTAFTGAIRDAGIDDFCFHDLRHTFATRLNEAGVDQFTIRDLLGHSTITMSGDYTHSTADSRHQAIRTVGRTNAEIVPLADYGKIPA